MDEKLARKINRQLRAIKVMLGFFSLLIVGMFILLGFIAYKVVTFTRDVNTKITNIEQTTTEKLDVKAQFCNDPTSSLARQLCQ
jgi:hypothetical protein